MSHGRGAPDRGQRGEIARAVAGATARLVWMPPIDPAQRMRSRRRHVLRVGLAIAAETARGFHALFERHKPAILAANPVVVNRAPRIILGFGAISRSDDTDANS
jgi:hypothetical protein